MIGDIVLLESGDYIPPSPRFKHARFLAHDLEGGADVTVRQHLRQALARLIIRGQNVILSVEPKDNAHLRGGGGLEQCDSSPKTDSA